MTAADRRPRPPGAARSRRARAWTGWVMVALAAVLLGGCALNETGDLPQSALTPAPDSPAQAQDALWNLVAPIALGVFILVQGLIIFAVWRYRDRGEDQAQLPKQVAGNTRLEIFWTVIPALILAGIAIPTVSTLFALYGESEDALHVRVIAKQYWWEFEYEDPEQQNVVTATQLHIPTGREVQLDMQSVSASVGYDPEPNVDEQVQPRGPVARGVIHSFWVPGLAGKHDVVPGHTREMKISTSQEGLYIGQCAEFCGLSHANMKFTVLAQSPEEFDAWIASQAEPAQLQEEGLAAVGQELFVSKTCVTCHSIEGHPENLGIRVGPVLTHFNQREQFASFLDNNDELLAAWLRDPQAVKPGAQMPDLQLNEEEIAALIAYLRTLD